MKKLSILFSLFFVAMVFLNFTAINANDKLLPEGTTLKMTEEVKKVIDNSCFGCHHDDSKNDKAKKKLNFDSFGKDYSTIKSGGLLKEIATVVSDGDMPPAKYLTHYPEKALSDAQKTLLNDWARSEASRLMQK